MPLSAKALTAGPITPAMLRFAAPMILGNLLQQGYTIVDALIVGRLLGANALAAAGSAYTLMTFLNSVLIGLCMGSGTVFSLQFGAGQQDRLRQSALLSFAGIGALSLIMTGASFAGLDPILRLLQTPEPVYPLMRDYVLVIFAGIPFVFLYNWFSFLLRAVGNSLTPLLFLGAAAAGNIGLDLWFVAGLHRGIGGAAFATVLSEIAAGAGLGVFTWLRCPGLRPAPACFRRDRAEAGLVARLSLAACLQQSVMNFGILMVQGLVNSFGPAVMAAFAAGVKVDSFAYMPAQEFANAYSLFVSQNHGAGRHDRVRRASRSAVLISLIFCTLVSAAVFAAAPELIRSFLGEAEGDVVAVGVEYLRIEGALYGGIGLLFLWYGYFRGIGRAEISLLLTVISLGLRVALAYALAPGLGVQMIWAAVPIGWIAADLTGLCLYLTKTKGVSP